MKHSEGSRENGMRRCPTFQWALDRIKGVSPPHVWYLITCTPSRFRRLNTNPNPNHLFHSTDGNTRKQKVIPEDDALLNCNLHGSSAIGCLCVLDAPSSRRHRTAGLISLLLCQPPTSQPRPSGPEAGSFHSEVTVHPCVRVYEALCNELTRASQNDFTDQDKPTSHPNRQEMMQQATSVRNGQGTPSQRWTVWTHPCVAFLIHVSTLFRLRRLPAAFRILCCVPGSVSWHARSVGVGIQLSGIKGQGDKWTSVRNQIESRGRTDKT